MIRPPTSKWFTRIKEIATGVADFFFLVWWIIIRPLVIWITSKLLLDMRFLLLLTAIFFAWASASCQTTQRIKLTQLERSAIVEGARSGQIGLTNANGDQRYAQYVEVNLTPIAYVPATSGNANNLSEFVVDPNADVWFIDWQGNAIQLKVCDNDWLVIGNNECPDAVTDSIYHYKYAAIGARYVWPNAEFLVSDSVGVGISGISGNRNARLFLYDQGSTGAFTIDQGGSSTLMYIEQNGELRVATSTGTAETPILGTNHFAVNATDSTVQMHRYPQTRNDTGNPVNVLSTDATGKVRSHPVAEVVSAAGGVTGSGASPQVAYFNGASSVTSTSNFAWNNAIRALQIGSSAPTNGNAKTNLILGGVDTVVNAAGARLFRAVMGGDIRTSNQTQHVGYISTSPAAGFPASNIYVDHNNTNVIPYNFTAPTITIAGGVTGTVRNQTVLVQGASGMYSALYAQASSANNAAVIEATTGNALVVANSPSSTNATSQTIDVSPSVNGNFKQALRLNNFRTAATGNGIGIDFMLRRADGGMLSSYLSSQIIDHNTSTYTNAFLFETLLNNSRAEDFRVSARSIGVNLAAQPSATIHAKGSGSTSATYTARFQNSADSVILSVRNDGNVGINAVNPGASLGIQSRGNTSATNALLIRNTSGTNMLAVRDDAKVGIGTDSPAASAILDVTSTTGGILLPRMTTTQRNAIATPADGLIIFCTDCTATDGSTGVSQTYSSSAWRNHY